MGEASPGDVVMLRAGWRALGPISEDLEVFVHIVDGSGRLVAQMDGFLTNDPDRMTPWDGGHVQEARYGARLLLDLAAGEFELRAGFYGVESGKRLTVAGSAGRDQRIPARREVLD
jgi:hypothetical protein